MEQNNLNERVVYTPLKRFMDLSGYDRDRITMKRKRKISQSRRYKQWKKLYLIAKMAAKNTGSELQEAKLDIGEFSKKYKHLHPEIKRLVSRELAGYIHKGYSKISNPVIGRQYGNPITKKGKISRKKVYVGKYSLKAPKKGTVHFIKNIDPYKIGQKARVRLPFQQSYISGSQVKRMQENYNQEKSSKVSKILQKNKQINKEIKLNKNSGNVLLLNPEL